MGTMMGRDRCERLRSSKSIPTLAPNVEALSVVHLICTRRLVVNRRVLSSADEESDVIIAPPPARCLRATIRSSSPVERERSDCCKRRRVASRILHDSHRVQHIYVSDDDSMRTV
ncbi:hypothetical protein B0H19DRAFT_1226174 [Mycena capillaripes]|nr:hypothetical protein B0H19DRAFT_1226174 [Mycena capillaripes]